MAGEALSISVPAGAIVVAQAEGVPIVVPGGAPAAEEHATLVEGVEVADDHAEEEATFPPFDSSTFASQLLWLVISFGALYILMSKVVLPRIGGILESRRDRIAADLDQAERLKLQSDDAIASYERALAEARAGAFAIANEARDEAKAEAAKSQAATEASLADKLAAAEKRIGEIKAKALADVEAIAAEATEAAVSVLFGKAPTAAEVNSAIAAAKSKEGARAE